LSRELFVVTVRRVPFAQIFQVKCEVEGESLGILTHAATPEIKEIIAGSPAAQAGINPKAQCSCPLSKGTVSRDGFDFDGMHGQFKAQIGDVGSC
jgi:hypothetical protein